MSDTDNVCRRPGCSQDIGDGTGWAGFCTHCTDRIYLHDRGVLHDVNGCPSCMGEV